MKKILSIFVLVMLSVMVYGQHLKFMGIPLDGTINAFHQKLVKKGFTPNVEFNKECGPDCRSFDGMFCGMNAQIIIYYNPKTKIVWGGRACIINAFEENTKSNYSDIKDMIEQKYTNKIPLDDNQSEYDGSTYMIFDTPHIDTGLADELGIINLFISKEQILDMDTYALYIDYTDNINSNKNKSSLMDDL